MRHAGVVTACLAISFLAPALFADDICIPNPIAVNAVEGSVYLEAEGKSERHWQT